MNADARADPLFFDGLAICAHLLDMERSAALDATIEQLGRYIDRLNVDAPDMIIAENAFLAAEGDAPTTNTAEQLVAFHERCRARYLTELGALPRDGDLHPMAAVWLRFWSDQAESWIASDSSDYEARGAGLGIFMRDALQSLDPAYEPFVGWEDEIAAFSRDLAPEDAGAPDLAVVLSTTLSERSPAKPRRGQ